MKLLILISAVLSGVAGDSIWQLHHPGIQVRSDQPTGQQFHRHARSGVLSEVHHSPQSMTSLFPGFNDNSYAHAIQYPDAKFAYGLPIIAQNARLTNAHVYAEYPLGNFAGSNLASNLAMPMSTYVYEATNPETFPTTPASFPSNTNPDGLPLNSANFPSNPVGFPTKPSSLTPNPADVPTNPSVSHTNPSVYHRNPSVVLTNTSGLTTKHASISSNSTKSPTNVASITSKPTIIDTNLSSISTSGSNSFTGLQYENYYEGTNNIEIKSNTDYDHTHNTDIEMDYGIYPDGKVSDVQNIDEDDKGESDYKTISFDANPTNHKVLEDIVNIEDSDATESVTEDFISDLRDIINDLGDLQNRVRNLQDQKTLIVKQDKDVKENFKEDILSRLEHVDEPNNPENETVEEKFFIASSIVDSQNLIDPFVEFENDNILPTDESSSCSENPSRFDDCISALIAQQEAEEKNAMEDLMSTFKDINIGVSYSEDDPEANRAVENAFKEDIFSSFQDIRDFTNDVDIALPDEIPSLSDYEFDEYVEDFDGYNPTSLNTLPQDTFYKFKIDFNDPFVNFQTLPEDDSNSFDTNPIAFNELDDYNYFDSNPTVFNDFEDAKQDFLSTSISKKKSDDDNIDEEFLSNLRNVAIDLGFSKEEIDAQGEKLAENKDFFLHLLELKESADNLGIDVSHVKVSYPWE